jgi:hypothetical protein
MEVVWMGGEGELDLVTTGGAEGKTGQYCWSGRMSPVLYVCVDIPLDQSARGEAKGKGAGKHAWQQCAEERAVPSILLQVGCLFWWTEAGGTGGMLISWERRRCGAEWSLPTARQQRLDEGHHVELDATVQPNGSTSAACTCSGVRAVAWPQSRRG